MSEALAEDYYLVQCDRDRLKEENDRLKEKLRKVLEELEEKVNGKGVEGDH